jgi:hypothetical protein
VRALPAILVILFGAGNILLIPVSPYWYIQTGVCGLFLLVAFYALIRDINRFYVLCAGEPAVIAAGAVGPWEALGLQLILLAMLLEGTGFLHSVRDSAIFGVFCLAAAAVTAFVLAFRHVSTPLFVLVIAGLAVVAICLLAEHQYTARFRRKTA